MQETDKPTLKAYDTILVFLKHFDARKQTLLGLGKKYVLRNSRPADLCPTINQELKRPPSTSLKFYEEVKPGLIQCLNPNETFSNSEIQDGDIICVQIEMTREEIKEIESSGLCTNPVEFYKLLQAGDKGSPH